MVAQEVMDINTASGGSTGYGLHMIHKKKETALIKSKNYWHGNDSKTKEMTVKAISDSQLAGMDMIEYKALGVIPQWWQAILLI